MINLDKYLNEVSDEKNPAFIFNMTHTELLLKIANKRIDVMELVKQTLAGRGVDKRGK